MDTERKHEQQGIQLHVHMVLESFEQPFGMLQIKATSGTQSLWKDKLYRVSFTQQSNRRGRLS